MIKITLFKFGIITFIIKYVGRLQRKIRNNL